MCIYHDCIQSWTKTKQEANSCYSSNELFVLPTLYKLLFKLEKSYLITFPDKHMLN